MQIEQRPDWIARRDGTGTPSFEGRSWADVDYGRVVHSGSFRRLQGKTQILNLGDSDFYRNRLTHSLEVAQIAGGVTKFLGHTYPEHKAVAVLPDLSMIQAVGFTHDLGHPPFGHGGEVALNYCMRDHGGFEGNGQTLRILSRLEKFSESHGANLARRTLLGVLKYPVPFSKTANPALRPATAQGPTALTLIDRVVSKPPKCYLDSEQDVVDWILQPLSPGDRARFTAFAPGGDKHNKPLHKSFDCSIMDLADDIGFGVHDLEDAVAMGLIGKAEFTRTVTPAACSVYLDWLREKYKGEAGNNVYGYFIDMLFSDDGRKRKRCISRMVNFLIGNCHIETLAEFDEPLLRYRAAMHPAPRAFLKELKDAVHQLVISSPSVQHLEFKGQRMVVSVFETFQTEPKAFLPRDTHALYQQAQGETARMRVICDHISGMTDSFLLKTYERLFSPRMGSIFDRL